MEEHTLWERGGGGSTPLFPTRDSITPKWRVLGATGMSRQDAHETTSTSL